MDRLLFFLLTVAIADLGYVYFHNRTLTQAVEDMEENLSNMTSSWKTHVDDVEKQVRELQTMAGSLKAQADQFQTLKKSVEDAVFQNKLHSLEIKDLKDTTSEITSLRKSTVTLEVSTQKGSLRLQAVEDKTRRMEQEFQTVAGSLKAQRDEFHALKKSVDDVLLQSKRHSMDIQSLKQTSSDISSLGKSVNDLDVLTTKMDRRVQDLEDRGRRMEQTLDKLSRNDQEFREQIQKFKHLVEDYQRSSNNRNPISDVLSALSGVFDFFMSPFREIRRRLLT